MSRIRLFPSGKEVDCAGGDTVLVVGADGQVAQRAVRLGGAQGSQWIVLDGLKAERPNFDYGLRELFSVAPVLTERERPVARDTARAVQEVLGREARFVCSPGTYDQKHIDRIGRLRDCIAYGPGLLALAHQPDEYVGIRDMVLSAQVMALAAWGLLSAD